MNKLHLEHSEAFLNGWAAHRDDIGVEHNPYILWTQTYSRDQWLSGWSTRFSAVKHGGDLDLDFHL